MNEQKTKIRWVRVGVDSVKGFLLIMIMLIIYTLIFDSEPDTWCIDFYPDGSEKVFYGDDCQLPQENNLPEVLITIPILKR